MHAFLYTTLLFSSLTAVELADPSYARYLGLHLPKGRDRNGLDLRDGAAQRWIINQQGMGNDGSRNLPGGAMRLNVNGIEFYNATGNLSADGREIEFGMPSNDQQFPVRLWRRVYIHPRQAYCRWIDIFENTSPTDYSLAIQYFTYCTTTPRTMQYSNGTAEPADGDWGLVTAGSKAGSAIVHVFGGRGTKVKPAFAYQSGDFNNLTGRVTVTVPAGKTVALCFFMSQQKTFDDGVAFLRNLDLTAAMAEIPQPLRRIIVNIAPWGLTSLGRIDLPRDNQSDLVILRDGEELRGEILTDRFTLETSFGPVALDSRRVVGFCPLEGDDPYLLAGLADGQIVVGRLKELPLRIRRPDGSEVALAGNQIASAAYRLSAERPEVPAPRQPMVTFRNGQRLSFTPAQQYTFLSEYGRLTLDTSSLAAILLDSSGGLHQVVFRNGSTLPGLLTADALVIRLAMGSTPTVARSDLTRLDFFEATPATAPDSAAVLTLRNGHRLLGRIADETINLTGPAGPTAIRSTDVQQLEFAPDAVDLVKVTLVGGEVRSGRLVSGAIRFKLEPGPDLTISIGHIQQIAPAPSTKDRPEYRRERKPT